MSKFDEACRLTPTPRSGETESSSTAAPLDIDLPCEDKSGGSLSARSIKPDVGAGDVASQTRRETGCNPENAFSLSHMSSPSDRREPLGSCTEKHAQMPRNPITGLGLGEDGVGGIKPKKPKSRRDGNPVTGEGYKSGNEVNNSVPSMNGANQIINKNRIPPGGFSSGLW